MKKILSFALMAMIALSASAAKKKEAAKDANKPVFTVIKELPITTIKDQNRSGTCWDYSTLSFFEAEILKATGKRYTLCEAFVANKTYMERAIQVVRYHGDCQFAQGGSAEDVLSTLKNHGICPLEAMPFPGSLYGDSLNNFNEFFSLLEPYVAAIAKSDARKRWVCRVSSTPTSASARKSSPTRERNTPRRRSWRASVSTSMTMSPSPATPITPSIQPSLWRYRTTGASR